MGSTGEEIAHWIYSAIMWLSIIYNVAAVIIEIVAVKIDPLKKKISD